MVEGVQQGPVLVETFFMASNTCNHVVTFDCHLIGSHLFEFVCLLWTGSVL